MEQMNATDRLAAGFNMNTAEAEKVRIMYINVP